MSETEPPAPDATPLEPDAPAGVSISRNGLILIATCLGLGAALVLAPGASGVLSFLFVATTWILAVSVHEFCHAFVAYRAGDTSVAAKGYLSLDPLKYSDLYITLLLPLIALALGGIGFPGGAVYLRPDLMRSRTGRSLASLAGPAGTLIVLLALAAILRFGFQPGDESSPLYKALAFLAFLQATALVLNLLPVPGLDGYGVLRPFLPERMKEALKPVERVAFLILFGLIFFVPMASALILGAGVVITVLLGVPGHAISEGWRAFQFWGG